MLVSETSKSGSETAKSVLILILLDVSLGEVLLVDSGALAAES